MLKFAVLTALTICAPLATQAGVIQTYSGTSAGTQFGSDAAMAGDVNGDGFCDVIVGAEGDGANGQNAGTAFVFSGRDGALLHRFDGARSERLGFGVDGAGDVDADGYADLIVGAPQALNQPGLAYVFSGADGSLIYTLQESGSANFGATVRGAGDVNADGFADVIAKARTAALAIVYSGLDGTVLHRLWSGSGDVNGVGDVNGDGFDDVAQASVVGAGRVTVFSGRDGSQLFDWQGTNSFQLLGLALSGAGDVDADGFADVIVADNLKTARVFSGFDGSVLHTITEPTATNGARSVCGVGDVDHDGHDDFVFASVRERGQVANEGAIRLYSGASGSLLRRYAGSGPLQFGALVDGNGQDVDGDGTPDFVATTRYGAVSSLVHVVAYRPLIASVERIHGAGCAGGSGAIPRIGHRGFAHVGTMFDLTLRGAAPNANAVLSIGSATDVPLDVLGLAGCSLYVDAFANLNRVTSSYGMSSAVLTIAGNPGLIGTPFEMQWSIVDGSAPYPLPLTFSDALSIVIGG